MSKQGLATIDMGKLRESYQGNPTAKVIFDYLATRSKNRAVTGIDRLLSSLARQGQEVSRAELIRLLRWLEDLGCGTFVTGRKGHPSRFEWSVSFTDLSRAAAGKQVGVEAMSEGKDEESEDGLLVHTFVLRPGLPVTISLPTDFSSGEALRLSEFVKTLPFERGA
jgi:hypothetical protein